MADDQPVPSPDDATPGERQPTFQVVVCDDDPVVRSVIAELVEERGGAVLAETSNSSDAIALSDRFSPDLVVLDLGLEIGSGVDVLEYFADRDDAPAVVVFTAFDGVVDVPPAGATVVRKPGFQELERAVDQFLQVGLRHEDRRRPTRTIPPPVGRDELGLDETGAFYEVLVAAEPDDVLLAVSTEGLDPVVAAATMRRAMRSGDRLTRRRDWLVALLLAGGEPSATAVAGRLSADFPDLPDRLRTSLTGDAPAEAFVELTAPAS